MLKPTMSAIERRIRARGGPWDEVFLASGAVRWCYEGLMDLPLEGWTVIDSSDQAEVETLEAVLDALLD